jgi:hypothetical protein
MARSDERAESARVLRDVRSTLTQMRTLCRAPTEVESKLPSLVNDVEDAEAAVADLPAVTRETLREITNKLEVVFRVLDIIGGHIARRRALTPADYGVGLLEFVSVLGTKLDDAIDLVADVERSLGTSALRRQAHPRTIDVPIEPDRWQAG